MPRGGRPHSEQCQAWRTFPVVQTEQKKRQWRVHACARAGLCVYKCIHQAVTKPPVWSCWWRARAGPPSPQSSTPRPAPTLAGHRPVGLDTFTKAKAGSLKGLLPHVCSQAHLLWAGGPPPFRRQGLGSGLLGASAFSSCCPLLPSPGTSERAVLAAGA